MKKLIALFLVAVLALSLCACGSNPYEKYEYINKMLDEGDYQGAIAAIYMLQLGAGGNTGSSDTGNTEPAKPTEEEIKLLDKYYRIYMYLTREQVSGFTHIIVNFDGENLSGQQALRYCYETLPQLSGIDKWADTDYVKEYYSQIENWDRNALLSGFTVVKNVSLSIESTKKDNLGNVSNDTVTSWKYNADGTVSQISGENEAKPVTHNTYIHAWPEYDAQGRIVKKTAGWSQSNITAIITYTYDDAGNITKEHCKTNGGEWDYVYTYKNGRLAKIQWTNENGNYRYTIEYTYDASGNLIKEKKVTYDIHWDEKSSEETMEYTYTDGKLTSGTFTDQMINVGTGFVYSKRVDQHTYTYDDQGRVLAETVIPGNTIDPYKESEDKVVDTPDYESKTYEYIYGDYYIYTPAN